MFSSIASIFIPLIFFIPHLGIDRWRVVDPDEEMCQLETTIKIKDGKPYGRYTVKCFIESTLMEERVIDLDQNGRLTFDWTIQNINIPYGHKHVYLAQFKVYRHGVLVYTRRVNVAHEEWKHDSDNHPYVWHHDTFDRKWLVFNGIGAPWTIYEATLTIQGHVVDRRAWFMNENGIGNFAVLMDTNDFPPLVHDWEYEARIDFYRTTDVNQQHLQTIEYRLIHED